MCYVLLMEYEEIEELRDAVKLFLQRKGHGALEELAGLSALSTSTVRRFAKKNRRIDLDTFAALAKAMRGTGYYGQANGKPVPLDPIAEMKRLLLGAIESMENQRFPMRSRIEMSQANLQACLAVLDEMLKQEDTKGPEN